MQVNQLMSKKVEWISPTVSLQEAARKMRDLDIGCLPVGDNDRLVGMITDRGYCLSRLCRQKGCLEGPGP
jgi:CBS domain-containing protein